MTFPAAMSNGMIPDTMWIIGTVVTVGAALTGLAVLGYPVATNPKNLDRTTRPVAGKTEPGE